jgi:hypothetical protein
MNEQAIAIFCISRRTHKILRLIRESKLQNDNSRSHDFCDFPPYINEICHRLVASGPIITTHLHCYTQEHSRVTLPRMILDETVSGPTVRGIS